MNLQPPYHWASELGVSTVHAHTRNRYSTVKTATDAASKATIKALGEIL